MPTFSSTAELQSYFAKKSARALEVAKDLVLTLISDYMEKFYSELDPVEYVRTGRLLQSIVVEGMALKQNGSEFVVCFDSSRMMHDRPYAIGQSGEAHSVDKSESWILNTVMTSSAPHGGIDAYGGDPIWPQVDPERHKDIYEMILVSALREAGIPII